jgi:radical SAM superfamily enzyme YgiQ (UPF0313 family)
MNVLLISANTESTDMIPLPLGLNCVAVAARNAGHDVHVLDLMNAADHGERIRQSVHRCRPGLIGISVRNVDNQRMSETKFLLEPVRGIVERCRAASDAVIVVGGAGFSIFPDAVLRYLKADMGICGEGEVAFTALLEAMEQGRDPAGLPGICLPGRAAGERVLERAELESLPLPDPGFWSVPPGDRGEVWVPYQTRRGCPMKCAYCSTPALEGTTIRRHPVEEVVEGIARHVAAGFHRFYFVDNTFNIPPEYSKELCESLSAERLRIQWRCILYPGVADEELVQGMAKAGCVEASLGFESGSPAILENLRKGYTVDQVRIASALLKKHGIKRMGFLLLGGPGETLETVAESLAFADSLELEMLKITMGIRIYPGTELEKTAREEGRIAEGDDLLQPRFYLARGLEEGLAPTVHAWMAKRPFCTL